MPLPQDAAPDALPDLARGKGDLAAYRGKAAGCGPTGSRRPSPSVPGEQRRRQERRRQERRRRRQERRSGVQSPGRPAALLCAHGEAGPRGDSPPAGAAARRLRFLPPTPGRPRAGAPPALPAGNAPTVGRDTTPGLACPSPSPGAGGSSAHSGRRLVPGCIRCPWFQQVALQIVPGPVKLPEPSEQSSPCADFPGCGCLRHNLGTAVSACFQSIHPCDVQWQEALQTQSQLPR